jgi:hypothetical protein
LDPVLSRNPVPSRLSRRAALILALAAVARPSEAALSLPAPLAVLRAELANFRYCADEVAAEGDDWWGFWWSIPERGCGDCEDFAAYSFARLCQLGVAERAIRLMAAEIGELRPGANGPATLVHVWLEVELAGATWTVSNREVRAGTWRGGRRMLTAAEVAALVDRRFGPNWPYGVDMP